MTTFAFSSVHIYPSSVALVKKFWILFLFYSLTLIEDNAEWSGGCGGVGWAGGQEQQQQPHLSGVLRHADRGLVHPPTSQVFTVISENINFFSPCATV